MHKSFNKTQKITNYLEKWSPSKTQSLNNFIIKINRQRSKFTYKFDQLIY